MALEIPTLMSPVGINADIIQDGVNGYLATEVDEWVQKIEYLIEHPEARLAMGRAGRQTVLDEYSVHANREKYLDAFRSLL
jgi:glycosyltransferase involved in cell wall biosynthesis